MSCPDQTTTLSKSDKTKLAKAKIKVLNDMEDQAMEFLPELVQALSRGLHRYNNMWNNIIIPLFDFPDDDPVETKQLIDIVRQQIDQTIQDTYPENSTLAIQSSHEKSANPGLIQPLINSSNIQSIQSLPDSGSAGPIISSVNFNTSVHSIDNGPLPSNPKLKISSLRVVPSTQSNITHHSTVKLSESIIPGSTPVTPVKLVIVTPSSQTSPYYSSGKCEDLTDSTSSVEEVRGMLVTRDKFATHEFYNEVLSSCNKLHGLQMIERAGSCTDKTVSDLGRYLLYDYCRYSNKQCYIWKTELRLWYPLDEKSLNIVLLNVILPISTERSLDLTRQIEECNDPKLATSLELLLTKNKELLTKIQSTRFLTGVRSFFLNQIQDTEFFNVLNKSSPYLLPVKNGLVIDMKTGISRKREPGDLFSIECSAIYDPTSTNSIIIDFLRDVYGYDSELLDYIIQIIGYSLLGINPEQKLFIFSGETGSNAKSTLLGLLNNFSNGLTEELNDKVLAPSKRESQNSHSGNLQILEGVRAGTISETDHKMKINETFLKKISGGDDIVGRKFGSSTNFRFTSVLKLWMACNVEMDLDPNSTSLWRRIDVIPHKYTYTDQVGRNSNFATVPDELIKPIDPMLRERLYSDEALTGFLNVVITGTIKYFQNGWVEPSIIKESRDSFRSRLDILGTFLSEKFEITKNPKDRIKTSEFRKLYVEWLQENSYGRKSSQEIRSSMASKGFSSTKYCGNPCYNSIKILHGCNSEIVNI